MASDSDDGREHSRDQSDRPADQLSPEEQIEKLDGLTRFTLSELEDLFEATNPDGLDREEFQAMLTSRGLSSTGLFERLWDVFDENDDGRVSRYEFILHLGRLTRGTMDELTREFFDLYDVDDNGYVGKEEIIEVYEQLLQGTTGTPLTDGHHAAAAEFIRNADTDQDGKLTYEEYHAAVIAAEKEAKRRSKNQKKGWRGYLRIATLVFLTSLFEMGTSFSLPAPGALSGRIKLLYDITDKEIGLLTGMYFAAAAIGPLVGGYFMDKFGPGPVLLTANTIVLIGAMLQAISGTAVIFWLMVMARFVIGFAGEVCPFTTVEILSRLFPGRFMLMCGVRNMVQSFSGGLAFILLPLIAAAFGECDPERQAELKEDGKTDELEECEAEQNRGTIGALWFCAMMAGLSVVSTLLVNIYMFIKRQELAEKAPTPGSMLRNMSLGIVPKLTSKLGRYKLPLSFFLSIYGIKATNYAPFAFTAFSVKLFQDRFGMTALVSSLITAYMHILGGALGPFMGPLSDWWGNRALSLGLFMIPTVVGFAGLAAFDSAAVAWIAVTLMAITYGFGDTVAYCAIRLIVGEERAGVGYGVYGVLGNGSAFIVPLVGGYIFDAYNGDVFISVYFLGLFVLATLVWIAVRLLEGKKSAVELPEKELIRTSAEDYDAAALHNILSSPGGEVPRQRRSNTMVEEK